MPQPLRKDQGPYQAGDVKLKVVGGAEPLTEEAAYAWLSQTVTPTPADSRTIDTTKEVQGA